MKTIKITIITLLTIIYTTANAQIFQFSTVSMNGEDLSTIPRFSWRIPLMNPIYKLENNTAITSGFVLKNEGVIYDFEGNRYKKRVISFGPRIGYAFLIDKSTIVSAAYGMDYNFHFQEKVLSDKHRTDKTVVTREWHSDRVNLFNHYLRIEAGNVGGITLFGEYYLRTFLNQNFTETINGIEVRPYENLNIQRFNFGISLQFALLESECSYDGCKIH